MSLRSRKIRRPKPKRSSNKHKGATCHVCGNNFARVTSTLSTGGTRRRKMVCMHPSCRAEVV